MSNLIYYVITWWQGYTKSTVHEPTRLAVASDWPV